MKRLNKIIGIMILFVVVLSTFSFAYTEEENEVLGVLTNFYAASVAGDVDTYIALHDPYFLEEISNNGEIDLKEVYRATFEEIKTSDVSIKGADVFIEDNTALVYYTIKGDYESKEGDSGTIENDMVAFFWKYDDWKIRWTMTRSLYEQKIGLEMAMDTVFEHEIVDYYNDTIKEELVAEGVDIGLENYQIEILDGKIAKSGSSPSGSGFSFSGFVDMIKNVFRFIVSLLVIIGIIALIVFIVKNDEKQKKRANKHNKATKKRSKKKSKGQRRGDDEAEDSSDDSNSEDSGNDD